MSKVGIIMRREYTTRIRNKTFIILTLLGPVFYGLLILMPVLVSQMSKSTRIVEVKDESGKFKGRLPNDQRTIFLFTDKSMTDIKKSLGKDEEEDKYVLYIPQDLNIYNPKGIQLLSRKNESALFKSYLDSLLANRITTIKMEQLHLSKMVMDSLHTEVDVQLQKSTEQGITNSNSSAITGVAVGAGVLIYIFIFLYGGMVLRGVQEEKQNRVVEVIISSVKPFQLMLGKILGIAMVGLTQFVIWILLTLLITTFSGQIATLFHGDHAAVAGAAAAAKSGGALSIFEGLQLPLLVGMFIFYFIGGYLLYSSLFAAVASAVDSQSDMNQFMLPITLPIIFSFSLISVVIDNPDSSVAFWASIIPLTSPIIMMVRLPFDVPVWQILLSMASLIVGFLLTTWMAAKIYRTGILMYGKKVTYKELAKWLFYKG